MTTEAYNQIEVFDVAKQFIQAEGIIPAPEPAHAIAEVVKRAPKMRKNQLIVVNLSGRGDKDVSQVTAKVKL
jgi:tryptophan synthase beta chain